MTDRDKGEKSPVLVLPTDPEKLGLLKRKHDEYKRRLDAARSEDPHKPPEVFPAYYSVKVLADLLENGSIDSWDYTRQIAREYGENSPALEWAANSLAVIDDYIKTGGENNRGGTGLH